jgi:hypothetical protein
VVTKGSCAGEVEVLVDAGTAKRLAVEPTPPT